MPDVTVIPATPAPATHTNGAKAPPDRNSEATPEAKRRAAFWTVPVAELYTRFGSAETGLTGAEAAARLVQFGPNDPKPKVSRAPILEFLRFVLNPLVVVLLIASLISAIMGDRASALIITIIVLLSIVLNFLQTSRSEQAARKLQAQIAPTATALRNGAWIEVPRAQIVPGDIVKLSAGDLVPADIRLVQEKDLHVIESALTGESMPVEKEVMELDEGATDTSEAVNSVFLGTSIASGTATGMAVYTGRDTIFGQIATRIVARPPETEFQRGIREFSLLITRTVFFLVLFVFLINLVFHRNPFESLLFSVALAVGLTPEFLPMITTITLTQGALRMSRNKVIVKNLDAIENLGSIDILCTDKTGTLTSGQMHLDLYQDAGGEKTDRALLMAHLNSFYETGIKSPFDSAILQITQPDGHQHDKVDEVPFDFDRRRLSVVVNLDGARLLITKGAPEAVLPICTGYEVNGERRDFDAAARANCDGLTKRLNAEGYRVLAVAIRSIPDQKYYGVSDEAGLTLVGYLAFIDPALPGVKEVLDALHKDGVFVKIITGDNDLVTKHIWETVGLGTPRVVLGSQMEAMDDAALSAVAERTDIFARVSPSQKNRIILALKARGHVVGYMGDGINDAPSLRAADVGISVANAVDVAREASDIILLESSLGALHVGILEGRRAFANVMKYLLMGTSSNFGNMFSMAGASVLLPFLPMLPSQILLNNFLYDFAQITIPSDNVDESYMCRPQHWNVGLIRRFMIYIGPISSIYDFLTFGALLMLFHASEKSFHTGWFVESLATQTLVLFVIRTAGNPFKSRPSAPLTITTLLVVLIGLVLPFTPLATTLGFVPLPLAFFAFLVTATVTYLMLVEWAKRRLLK